MKPLFMQSINRRRALKGAAAATVLSLGSRGNALIAAPPASPRRVVFVYVPGGAVRDLWHPDICGSNLVLKAMSAPLEPVKHLCTFFDKLEVANAGHGLTPKCLGLDYSTGNTTTLDMLLNERLAGQVPIPVLNLAVMNTELETVSMVDGQVVPYWSDPIRAYANVFAGDSLSKGVLDKGFDRDINLIQDDFDSLANLQIELGTLALGRNKSRVVSLMLGDHQCDFGVKGLTAPSYHQAIAAYPLEAYVEYRAYLAKKLAYLIQLLQATPDEYGRSLLDSTLVVQVSDMGDAREHTGGNSPYLFAGGSDFVRNIHSFDAQGRNQYDLLDTVAAVMGMESPYFGGGPIQKLIL